jgi:hypothetical protein
LSAGSSSQQIDESLFEKESATAKRKERKEITYLIEFIPEHLKKGNIEVDKTTLFAALEQ